MSDPRVFAGEALITNPTGLHARPAVKLTKLAKSSACEWARTASGPTPRASPASSR
jgi:phosphotransferase system HPr-like phosphotransfer protein